MRNLTWFRSVGDASSTGPRSWSSTGLAGGRCGSERAYAWLSRPPIEPAIGKAHYRRAELHRLRGDHANAEQDYRDASQWGRRPDPGLALLRLAQGDSTAAAASIRRALDEAVGITRARLLEPFPWRSCSPPVTWMPPAPPPTN